MKSKPNLSHPFSHSRCLTLVCLSFLASFATLSSHANILSWTGGGGGNANWNNSANWGFAGTPANGDTVFFPGGVANLLNTNNIAGLTLNSIHFAGTSGGFDIRGNALTVTNNISVTNSAGANVIEVNLTLTTAPSVLVIVSNGVSLTLGGTISGTAGVTKTGTGTLTYAGPSDNGYSGTTQVSGGTLQFNVGGSSAFGGSLVIGDGSGTGSPTVQLLQPTEIANTAPITINAGTLDLNGFTEVITASPVLSAATITTGAGTLMFASAPTITTLSGLSTISGNMDVGSTACTNAMGASLVISAVISGSATIYKSGSGTLTFSGANTYSGLTVVQQGILVAQNALALGTTGAGTVVSNTATLELAGNITIANEPLTLNGPGISSVWGSLDVEAGINTWAGPVTNNADSKLDAWNNGSELHISGPIVGAGGLELFNSGLGGGTHFFEGGGGTANTYAGTTTVDANTTLSLNKPLINYQTVPGALVINGTVRELTGYQLHFNSPVTINDGGLLDLNGWNAFIGALSGTASAILNLGTVLSPSYLYVNFGGGSSAFSGLITGNGTLDKQGIGNLTLNGNNTYTGTNLVSVGTLTVNGSQPQCPISVLNGTTLSGAGTVGAVTLTGSTIDTGASLLQINGDVTTLASTTTANINGAVRFAAGLRTITVNQGSAPGGYDVNINGSVSDFGAGLQILSVGAARGELNLNGTNTFSGPMIVGGPGLIVSANAPMALGTTNTGSTFVTNGASLWVYGTGITNETVTLAPGTKLIGQSSGRSPSWVGPVILLGDATIYGFNFIGTFDINGPISGTGNLTVVTDGETVRFSGPQANSYSGSTTLMRSFQPGTLQLAKTGGLGQAIPNGLVVSNECTLQLANSWQFYSPTKSILLNTNSLFDLAGNSEYIGPLTMQGAQITSGVGTLFLGDDVLLGPGPVLSTISGNLSLVGANRTINTAGFSYGVYSRNWDLVINANIGNNTAGLGLIKTGYGSVQLTGANTYTGPTYVQQGFLWLSNSLALGPAGSGNVVVSNGAVLVMDGPTSITNKPLTLNGPGWNSTWGELDTEAGTHTWTGPITNNANSTLNAWTAGTQLHLTGPISGPGGLELFGAGTHYFEGSTSNTYAGLTTVDYFVQPTTLVLNKTISYATVPTNIIVNGILRLGNAEQINTAADVQVNANGLFDFATFFQSIDTLHGTGSVTYGVNGYLNIGVNNGTSEFDGLMSGTGYNGGYTVGKFGTGTFTLTANNTYLNGNDIFGGTLIINGQQPQNPVSVAGSSGTLGGTGTVGIITSSGTVSPGNSPGILTSSNMIFNASGAFKVELAGPNPGSGYDQLNVTGTVSLASAKLQVKMSTLGATNAQYTIINNDASDSVSGTFLGLIEGATVIADNGAQFKITYKGGPGFNDVVLTQTTVATAPVMSGITRLGGGSIQLNGIGITNIVYSIQATTNLLSTNWVVIGTAAANSLGQIQFVDASAPNYPVRFYRFTWP